MKSHHHEASPETGESGCSVECGVVMMMFTARALAAMAALVLSATAWAGGVIDPNAIELVDAFPNLTFSAAADIKSPPDGSNRVFVVEQSPGVISVFDNDSAVTSKQTFLDLSGVVLGGVEGGVLSMAFHPDYANNGVFFVTYGTEGFIGQFISVLARFEVSDADPNMADPDSEEWLITITQSEVAEHNMHHLEFGPDGYLYVSVGDGDCCGDPYDTAQDLTDLRGSILRLDVELPSRGDFYSIPPDNPYAGNPMGYKEEIFHHGLRNPWRFSFDSEGYMWIGDVGQDDWEEVSRVHGPSNLGWPIQEGFSCYEPPSGCNTTGLTPPLIDYAHGFSSSGGFSVTGGYVYQGSACPDLAGLYIYGDFLTGNLWAMAFDGSGMLSNTTIKPLTGELISAFGLDPDGELLIASYGEFGSILKLQCASPCPYDVTGPEGAPNGEVDVNDFFGLLQHWGPCVGACEYDFTGPDGEPNGEVDVNDFFGLLQHWGPCP
jgi:glucose/arabinose dehydrogenase